MQQGMLQLCFAGENATSKVQVMFLDLEKEQIR